MDKETIEQKKQIIDELTNLESELIDQQIQEDAKVKNIKVQLKNNNIYINVQSKNETLGYQLMKAVPVERYEYIDEVELRTYNRKEGVKAVYVVYDYDHKRFMFKNPLKVTTIEEISEFDKLPP